MLQREMSQFLGGPIEKNRKSIFYRSPEVPTRALCSRLLVFLLLLLQAKRGKRFGQVFYTGTQHAAMQHGIGRFGTAR